MQHSFRAHALGMAWLVCGVLVAPAAMAQQNPTRVFRAGAATSNITPPLGAMIVGNWKPMPAETVHDEVFVRCLVLDDGRTQIAFVICDNVGIPREVFDLARKYIAAETSLPPQHVLMAATHTHSAATLRNEVKVVRDEVLQPYQQFVARRIGDAVRLALARREPARVAWGSFDEPSQVFNRRWHVTDPDLRKNPFGGIDQVRMNPPVENPALVRPAGPIDPEVSFLAVQTPDGRPLAVLANYSLHYVGGVPANEVSADYFGEFAVRLARHLGVDQQQPPFVAMMSNGTSGDINNINFAQKAPSKGHYEKINEVAELLAGRVAESVSQLNYQDWVPLGAGWRELTLQVRRPDPEMTDYLATLARKSDDEPKYHPHEQVYVTRIQGLNKAEDQIDVPLQAFRIGDLAIAAIPFEVFAEIGLSIKDLPPAAETFTIELANGSYGYLPSTAQHELGGYETWLGTNLVQRDAADLIVAGVQQLFAELFR